VVDFAKTSIGYIPPISNPDAVVFPPSIPYDPSK
ncbi:hypothetical protein TNCT_246531, partial [Trichonephila clavata]